MPSQAYGDFLQEKNSGDATEKTGDRRVLRFASTQEVLAPSNSIPSAQILGSSASFKDSDVRARAHNSLDALLQGNKRFVAVSPTLLALDENIS